MPEMRVSLFGKTKALESQIDEFLDTVSEGGMVFEQGYAAYVANGVDEQVEQKLHQIRELKTRGDELRRTIERWLYTEMLLPDSRGDVLSLLDDLGDLLREFKHYFVNMTIERPQIPDEVKGDFRQMTAAAVSSAEFTVQAARAFFRDFQAVRDHIHKIAFYEAESDTVALRINTAIFRSDLPLAQKMHVTNTVKAVDGLADQAKDTGDRLSIYAIKRSL